jgi:PAS domain S-box-containing protein
MSDRDRFLRRHGLDAEAQARRKAFLRLEPRDEAILARLREEVAPTADRLIEAFYDHLLFFEHTRKILLAEPGRLERLRELQKRYFDRLLQGGYDEAYFEERLRIGHAHRRAGVDPEWYLGAYALYLQLLLPAILEAHAGNPEGARETMAALVKVVMLDLGLAMDTYVAAAMSELESSRSYLERVLSSISDALVVTDAFGVIRDVNPALLELTGFTREEVVGEWVHRLFAGDSEERLRERLDRVAREGMLHDDRHLVTRQGERIPVAFSGSAIRDREGNLLGFVATMSDLRERQLLIAALEEAKTYFERVVTSISDGLIVLDPRGVIRDVNPALLKLSGYERPDLIGKSVLILWRDETEEALRQRLARTAEVGSFTDDRFLHGKEGSRIPVSFSGAPIRDREGEILGFVGLVRDMSERNRLLDALERAKATLEQRVEERTRELRRAQAQIFQSEKLSAVGQLAAGIAHEIGTPLNVISGRAEYLLSELGDDPRAQSLKVIVGQIDRITGLMNQLLDFARERGDEMGPVSLENAVSALRPLLEGRLRKQNVLLRADLEHVPEVYGNVNRLQQVFLNLIMNAADAIREARRAVPGQIAIEGEVRGDEVLVRVTDNGCGIPAASLPRIFDPFYTTKPSGQGTGLGLSVTFGLVQEMGGTIGVESEPGKGTTFTLHLRRAGPARSRASPQEP